MKKHSDNPPLLLSALPQEHSAGILLRSALEGIYSALTEQHSALKQVRSALEEACSALE